MVRAQFTALGAIKPSPEIRLGRMLAAGHLTATMTSKKTGEHITLRFDAKIKNSTGFPKWKPSPLDTATHVFINAGSGDRVATYYPQTGKLYAATHADPARVWAAEKILQASELRAGIDVIETGAEMDYVETLDAPTYALVSSNNCGKCHKELTDPVSVQRGFGPTCIKAQTGSTHQTKVRAQTALPVSHLQTVSATPIQEAAPQVVIAAVTDSKNRKVPVDFNELASRLGR